MRSSIPTAAAVFTAAVLASPGAAAQLSDNGQFGASLYGWFPSIGGKTTFPGDGVDVSIDSDQILDSLKFVFMGTLEARKGRWGGFTDVVYIDLGRNRSDTRDITIGGVELPANASASVNYDLKGTAWTLAGTYRVVADPGASVDLIAGARLLDVEQTLDWGVTGNVGPIPLPGRTGSRQVDKSNWDAIVGVKGRLNFGGDRRWFIPYYLDVGTGDSDMTWQAMAGVGYAWNWGDVFAAWRYLDYDMKSGGSVQDLNFSGPAIGLTFRW